MNKGILKTTVYDDNEKESKAPGQFEKVGSALFYGFSSLGVILVNKIVMTSYKFPHFDVLATAQFASTSFILTVLIYMGKVEVTRLSKEVVWEVLPITVMFLANVVSGLGGTGQLNLPMFTALRRTSILLTLGGEYLILGKKSNRTEMFSIVLMVGGAFIAAYYDLTFDASGYTLVTINNICTALNGVYLKKASIGGICNKNGVLFYNSLFSFFAMAFFMTIQHNYSSQYGGGPSTIDKLFAYEGWHKFDFVATFCLAAVMGSVLNYATFLCTTNNSALTTAVVGTVKNIIATYIGMFALSDYVFQILNFIGLNISIVGSVIYTYITFFKTADYHK